MMEDEDRNVEQTTEAGDETTAEAEVADIEAKIEAAWHGILVEGFLVILGAGWSFAYKWFGSYGHILGVIFLLFAGSWIMQGRFGSSLKGLVTLPFLYAKRRRLTK